MPVQRSQGRRRPQVPRSDELAAGVPAATGKPDPAMAEALARVQRTDGGTVADRDSARALGRLGGLAKAQRNRLLAETPRLVQGLGLRDTDDPAMEALLPYLRDGEAFAAAECERMAREVGGGSIGFGPASMVKSAALQLAASRFCFGRGDLLAGSRLADASRQNLLSARDECAREAELRRQQGIEADDIDWLRAGSVETPGEPTPEGGAS